MYKINRRAKELFVYIELLTSKDKHGVLLFAGIVLLACTLLVTPVVASTDSTIETSQDKSDEKIAEEATGNGLDEAQLTEIAKGSSNPLGAYWMFWLQNDSHLYKGDLLDGEKWVNTTVFQPVMSFPFKVGGEKWNLITRPVLQYQSMPLKTEAGDLFGKSEEEIASDPRLAALAADPIGRTSGYGDTALLTLAGPANIDGLIWGVGASQIFPSAGEDVLGQGKWQAGPAGLFGYMAPEQGGVNAVVLAQQWFSYAGDDDRSKTSLLNIQYFLNYRLTDTCLLGMAPNIIVDWEADSGNKLTLPIGLGLSDVIKIGSLPVRVDAEVQYSVVRPDDYGSEWNFRVMFIPIIKNPFSN